MISALVAIELLNQHAVPRVQTVPQLLRDRA